MVYYIIRRYLLLINNKPEIGSIWIHKKTGRKYKVAYIGYWEEDLELCVVYVSLDEEEKCWIRPLKVFIDGRFARI